MKFLPSVFYFIFEHSHYKRTKKPSFLLCAVFRMTSLYIRRPFCDSRGNSKVTARKYYALYTAGSGHDMQIASTAKPIVISRLISGKQKSRLWWRLKSGDIPRLHAIFLLHFFFLLHADITKLAWSTFESRFTLKTRHLEGQKLRNMMQCECDEHHYRFKCTYVR